MKRILSLLLSVVLVVSLIGANAVPVSAAAEFSISDECVELLKSMEGFDKYPRWDYSQWTVGHGSRCPDEDLERYRENGITYEEADALLRKHANTFAKSLNSFIDKYNLSYTQQQFDALLLFTYNFGPAWMFRESSAWRAGLINGFTGNDFMFHIGQWCNAGGEILRPLINRRLIEANIFFNGVYSRTVPDNYGYVMFEFNGGEGETQVQAYDADLDAYIRVIPTRAGYTFAGWYTAIKGGKKITELDRSTKGMTLYARWVEGENAEIEDLPEEELPEDNTIDPVLVTVDADYVNIRTGPGTNYSVADNVRTGTTMTITEIQGGSGYTWGKFAEERWIALMYTNYEEVIKQQGQTPTEPTEPPTEPTEPPVKPTEPPVEPTEPPVEPTEPPVKPTEPPVEPTEPPVEPTEPTVPPTEPTEPPTEPTEPPVEENPESAGVMGTVTGSDLRIRTGAGTNYDIVGWLQIGDRITVTERKTVGSMEWGKMESGWVSLTYVKLDEPAQEEKPEEPKEPETEPAEPEETTPVVMTGWVDVYDFLRIRKGAGLDYSVAGYYGPNDVVTILEIKDANGMTWGRTDKGWISMDYVVLYQDNEEPEIEEPEVEEPETESKVITGTVDVEDCLRVRSGPGTDYYIEGFLDPGDRVTITETTVADGMTWGKISNGWISMDYVIID